MASVTMQVVLVDADLLEASIRAIGFVSENAGWDADAQEIMDEWRRAFERRFPGSAVHYPNDHG